MKMAQQMPATSVATIGANMSFLSVINNAFYCSAIYLFFHAHSEIENTRRSIILNKVD
jgi:hypothetical protein